MPVYVKDDREMGAEEGSPLAAALEDNGWVAQEPKKTPAKKQEPKKVS